MKTHASQDVKQVCYYVLMFESLEVKILVNIDWQHPIPQQFLDFVDSLARPKKNKKKLEKVTKAVHQRSSPHSQLKGLPWLVGI